MTNTQPTIATNRPNEGVAQQVNGYLQSLQAQWAKPPDVSIATAYFNPAGFALLADQLEQCGHVRLLLGAEPQQEPRPLRRLQDPLDETRANLRELQQRVEAHQKGLQLERDQIGFSYESSAAALRLIEWLGSNHVEVRRLNDRFLHGKAFIVDQQHAGAMVGSSNFTYAGLARNLELNLFTHDPTAHSDVKDWYGEMWDAAEPFDLQGSTQKGLPSTYLTCVPENDLGTVRRRV